MFIILVHICGLENFNKNWKTLHLVVFSHEHPIGEGKVEVRLHLPSSHQDIRFMQPTRSPGTVKP